MWFIVLCSTLPWLAGGIAANLFCSLAPQKTGYSTLLFGVGGLLGTIGIALLTIAATWIGVSLVSFWAIAVLALFCVGGGARLYQLRLSREAAPKAAESDTGFITLTSLAFIVLIAGINAWQVAWIPAAGWDTLWSWAEISRNFIDTTQANPTSSWEHNQTHPSTVAIISAWAAAHIPSTGGLGPAYFSWWLAWLSILLIVYGYTEAVTKNINASALATVVSASIPLLTNHVILGGYAEIFLAATVTGATATLTLGIKERDGRSVLLGLLLASSCITLKNTGFLFSCCILLGYATCLAIGRGLGKWVILMTAVMGICVSLFILTESTQSLTVEIGNRQLILMIENAQFIPRNELISLFYNASFSNIALLFVAPIMFLDRLRRKRGDTEVTSFLMPWLTSLIMLGMLCASQLTDYGFLYAIPSNDTGNSRLSLPLVLCILLVIGQLWVSAVRQGSEIAAQ